MLRLVLLIFTLLTLTIGVNAQENKKPEFIHYDLLKGIPDKISPLEDGPAFIAPKTSLVKLQRQTILQLLPTGFTPQVEPEQDSSRRKLIRYGFAYYRDNEIPGFPGFRDIIVPLRFDSTEGSLDVKYYRNVLIVPFTFDLPENRSSIALLPQDEGTALLLFLEGTSNKFLLSLSNLFDDPKMLNFLAFDEVEAIQSDAEFQKFIIFTRGGSNRSSLFVLTTSANLDPISQGIELIKDLPINNESYIFKIFPNTELKFRGGAVPTKSASQSSEQK